MTKTNLTNLIDGYGANRAKAAEIEIEKKRIEKALADLDPGSYEGELFRLTITDLVIEGDDEDLKAKIKEVVEAYRATLSCQYRTAHTTKKPSRRHAAKARNGDVE